MRLSSRIYAEKGQKKKRQKQGKLSIHSLHLAVTKIRKDLRLFECGVRACVHYYQNDNKVANHFVMKRLKRLVRPDNFTEIHTLER